jgi:hypothetical protein
VGESEDLTAPRGASALPTGTVAILFTDLEGSTRLLQAHPAAYRIAVRRHHELLLAAVEASGGVVFETVGDAVYAAFERPTAATILASLPVERLATRRQVAASAGLCPRERTSGSSVRGRSRPGPLGPASLRKALYLPAVVAMRAHPALRAFAERLRAAGKGPKVVVVAVMRKLPELAWTLLRSGQPFSLSQGTRASTP